MTVATLTFDLESEEDRREFGLAVKSTAMALTLVHLDEKLRQLVKYEDLPPETSKAYDKARDMLHEAAEEEGLRIGDLFDGS